MSFESRLLAACSAAILLAGSAAGQDSRGQILGRVTDSSDAVIAGVRLTAVNRATGVKTATLTNSTGDYAVPFLNPGTYDLTAEMSGFRSYRQEAVQVQVSDHLTINISLQVGSLSEQVKVVAEAPLVESATASLGQVVDNRRVVDLPLKDGNPMMLASITPGVMNFTTASMTVASAVGSPASISVNGVRSTNNEFSMDGAPNTSRAVIAYAPPAEVVQEFKMQTATFDPAQGFTPGATINVTLKAGTNQLHGSAHNFVQNPVFNANKFFSNRARLSKAILRMNRYGVNGDGPIVVPRLYNGKDRTFFTYGYEGFKLVDPRGTLNTTVPTAAQRGGDFSQLLRLGAQYQIYDPATIAPAAGGRFSRLPLAGNIIPASRINPISAKLVQYWSQANLPGTADGQQNWTSPGQEWMHYYTHVARFDHTISEKQRMFVRLEMNNHDQQYDVRSKGAMGSLFHRRNTGIALDDVYVFNPGFLLNVRYSFTRFVEASNGLQNSFDLAGLGFSQTFLQQLKGIDQRGVKLPRIDVTGYDSFSTDNAWASRGDGIHSLGGNVTRVVRAHSLRFGAEYRIYQENVYNLGQSSGNLVFGTDWTRGPLDNSSSAPIGQGMAQFLFGIPSSGSIVSNDSYAEQSSALGLYFGDDWKVTSKLTINLGLRYELEVPITERFNRSVSGFDLTTASPIEAQAKAKYAQSPIPQVPADRFRAIGGLLFAGVGGQARTLWNYDKNNFMPRFGFAYAVNPRTVIRGGYGVFCDQLGITRQHVNQTGYSRTTNLVASLDNGQTYAATFANPFPAGFAAATGSASGLQTFMGQSVTYFNPDQLTPYMQRWQIGVQRQLIRDTVMEIAYVGNRGTKQRISRQKDPVPREYYSTSAVRDQAAIDFQSAQVANPFYPLLPGTSLSGQNVSRSQLLRPYPQFTSIAFNNNQGYSWYHAMQTRFEKRFAAGYTFNVAWTWSKFMEATGYLNDTDPVPERVISDQDRTHRLVVTGLWELPFGRGRRFGRGASGLLDRVIGQWQIQGIFQGQSGAALGFGNAIFNGDLSAIPLADSARTVDRWFNVDAGFEKNSARQLSTNIRTQPSRYSGIRGDGINNWDLSVIKGIRLTERLRFQLRTEFINAWNHTQFAAPNTTPSSSGFGTVTAESQYARTIQFAAKLVF
jgi:hypothetical protein